MNKQQIKELLQIKNVEDITSLNIIDEYEDDHQQCAEVEINGVPVEFLWFDELGFLYYYNESPKAATKLIESIRFCCYSAMERLEEEDFKEVAHLHSELAKEFK